MSASLRWVLAPALVAGGLFLGGAARAATNPEVIDNAGFFSSDAVKKANEQIREIKKKYHKDLLIETMDKLPAERQKELDRARADGESGRFWAGLSRQRAERAEVDGVYILICKSPGHVEVTLREPSRRQHAFTSDDRNRLAKILLSEFRDDKKRPAKERHDEGLKLAVNFVQERLAEGKGNVGAVPPAGEEDGGAAQPRKFNWAGLICTGLVVLAVVWIVIALIRASTGWGHPGYYGGPGYGYGYGGGGGFFPSLLGGLFGAAAGMWMYNHFFGGGGPSAYGGDPGAGAGAGAGGFDTSSTGGDFDDGGAAGG
ncbi:MAG TPA: hypothetical protein VFA26_22420, partial [Gemmataceae bacterium]|nr:hypothetical protein [Gemmataceae bacterium]